MKQFADQKRSDKKLEVGEQVYLRLRYPHLKAISKRPVNKLTPRYFGPFTITNKIGEVAYKL